MANLSGAPIDIAAYVAVKYWPNQPKVQEQAMAVMYCESGYRTSATQTSSREHSVGPWQINLKAHGKSISEKDARDWDKSTAFAKQLWAGSGGTFAKHWVNCSRSARVTSDMRKRLETQRAQAKGDPGNVVPGVGPVSFDPLGDMANWVLEKVVRVLVIGLGAVIILIALYMLWKGTTATEAARRISNPVRRLAA